MKNTLVVTALLMTFMVWSHSGQAESDYKGKLNCKNVETLINSIPDGRVRALCDEATRLCMAQAALSALPVGDSLRAELEAKLTSYLDMQFGICESGFLSFVPSFYHDNLAR